MVLKFRFSLLALSAVRSSHSYFWGRSGRVDLRTSHFHFTDTTRLQRPFCPWNRRVFVFICIQRCSASIICIWFYIYYGVYFINFRKVFCRKMLGFLVVHTQLNVVFPLNKGDKCQQPFLLLPVCLAAWQSKLWVFRVSRWDAASDFTTAAAAASCSFGAGCVLQRVNSAWNEHEAAAWEKCSSSENQLGR